MTVLVGNGYKSEPITSVEFEPLWKIMITKVYHPNEFLPVKNVISQEKDDGSIYREMTMISNENIIKEVISINKENGEICFKNLQKDETIVNVYHKDDQTIEYYMKSSVTGERIEWKVDVETVKKSIAMTVKMASSL